MTTILTILTTRQRRARRTFLRLAKRSGNPPDQLSNFKAGGYGPQETQLSFHAHAREADEPNGPTRIAQAGARGGSKSHAAACQVALDDCVRYPGLKWLYLRSVGKSARESFEDLLSKALPSAMPYYVASRSVVELPNGSRILLGGFRTQRDIEKYIGVEYDGIVKDDAHMIAHEKHKQIDGSLRTSKLGWRPRQYVTFNPGGVGHAYLKRLFVEPWREQRETDTRFTFSLPEDNAFLNPEYIQYLDGLEGWLYRAWRRGDFDIAAGQFFTNWRRDIHVIEAFQPPLDWRFWLAMDYGSTHWNVVYLLVESNDGIIYVIAEHAARRWLVPQHAKATREMTERWKVTHRIREFVSGSDVFAARGTTKDTIADQWQREGYELVAAKTDRIQGAAEMLRRLGSASADPPIAPSLYIFENCKRLIECLPSLENDPSRPEDVLKVDCDAAGNGGDDAYDAARYGVMARMTRRFDKVSVGRY